MKFIATDAGYVNAAYVRRLYVSDKTLFVQDDRGGSDVHERFRDNETAQAYLDELVEELEKDE